MCKHTQSYIVNAHATRNPTEMCAPFVRIQAGHVKIFWEEMWIYVIHSSIITTEVRHQVV